MLIISQPGQEVPPQQNTFSGYPSSTLIFTICIYYALKKTTLLISRTIVKNVLSQFLILFESRMLEGLYSLFVMVMEYFLIIQYFLKVNHIKKYCPTR